MCNESTVVLNPLCLSIKLHQCMRSSHAEVKYAPSPQHRSEQAGYIAIGENTFSEDASFALAEMLSHNNMP